MQYSPNEVKLAVAGDGGADKAQVQAMVTRLLRLRGPPRPPDAADALALALCHLWRAPLRSATAARRAARPHRSAATRRRAPRSRKEDGADDRLGARHGARAHADG